MDRTVELVLKDVLHEANDKGCNLSVKRVEKEGYIITNEDGLRVVGLGIFSYKEKDPMIGAFVINVKNYKWADAEGFTLDDMVDDDKLAGTIFNLIPVDEVFDFLCNKK